MVFPLCPMPGVFGQIPNVKGNYRQLKLLPQMNAFVVEQHRIVAVGGVAQQHEGVQGNGASEITGDQSNHPR